MAIITTHNSDEIAVDDEGVWVEIRGVSVKVRVIDRGGFPMVVASAWLVNEEDNDPPLAEFMVNPD